MVDNWRPITWLLAAACGWGLVLLIAVIAGLGSRFSAPANTTAPRVAAPVLAQRPSRLGPIADYREVGSRPLLSADRRPELVAASNGAGGTDLDLSLTSILITPTLKMAILTGNQDGRSRRVRLGEVAEGSNWRLVRLEPRRAVFDRPTGELTLELRLFDGKGTAVVPLADAGATNAPVVPEPDPANARPVVDNGPSPGTIASPQAQQIEAIRRRIEARRAQMRAEANKSDADSK